MLYLHFLAPLQADYVGVCAVLDDWTSRSAVYKMSDDKTVRSIHDAALPVYKQLQAESLKGSRVRYVGICTTLEGICHPDKQTILALMSVDLDDCDNWMDRVSIDETCQVPKIAMRPLHFICKPSLLNDPSILDESSVRFASSLTNFSTARGVNLELKHLDTDTVCAKKVFQILQHYYNV
jgi:hypothetical protein